MSEQILYKDLWEKDVLDLLRENSEEASKIDSLIMKEDQFAVDIDEIIDILGLEVQEMASFSKSGMFDSDNDTIYVNMFDVEKRQRFTKAHEIGHYVLGHEGTHYRHSVPIPTVKEREANNFAAELLMPKKLILRGINKIRDEDSSRGASLSVDEIVNRLAGLLHVSKQAMEYRMINLNII